MFNPLYTITPRLLERIKRIATLSADLNRQAVPKKLLVLLERKAREISAHASTGIEGNPLSLEAVKALLRTPPRQVRNPEREVLNYNRALDYAHRLIRYPHPSPLNLKMILDIHRLVTDHLLIRHRVGRLRKEAVFVNDFRSGQPIFLPPDWQQVSPLLKDLLHFLQAHRLTLDPLILAGLFHKQFVIIHPFMDGNGRTVRLITTLLLARMGLNWFTLFSFERYYHQNVIQYFHKVGVQGNYDELKDGIDFTEWLEYFAEGIVNELERIALELKQASSSPQSDLQSYHQAILDYLRHHDYITDRDYGRLTERAKATRVLDFKKLMGVGLIERFGQGRATHYRLTNG